MDTEVKTPTKGAIKAAEVISRFTTLNNKNGVPWAAEVIDRETKAGEMADLLRETLPQLHWTNIHGSRCDELIAEIEALLSTLEKI